MGALPEGGAMAAIEATEAEIADSIEGKEQDLAIAGLNSPTSTVISGTEDGGRRDPQPPGRSRDARPNASPSPTPSTHR